MASRLQVLKRGCRPARCGSLQVCVKRPVVLAVLQTCMSLEQYAGRNITRSLSVRVSARHVCPLVTSSFVPKLMFVSFDIGQLYHNKHSLMPCYSPSFRREGVQSWDNTCVWRMYQTPDSQRGARPAAPAADTARSSPGRVWQLSTLATWRAGPSTGCKRSWRSAAGRSGPSAAPRSPNNLAGAHHPCHARRLRALYFKR